MISRGGLQEEGDGVGVCALCLKRTTSFVEPTPQVVASFDKGNGKREDAQVVLARGHLEATVEREPEDERRAAKRRNGTGGLGSQETLEGSADDATPRFGLARIEEGGGLGREQHSLRTGGSNLVRCLTPTKTTDPALMTSCVYCDEAGTTPHDPVVCRATCSDRCEIFAHASCFWSRRTSRVARKKQSSRPNTDAEVCPHTGCVGKLKPVEVVSPMPASEAKVGVLHKDSLAEKGTTETNKTKKKQKKKPIQEHDAKTLVAVGNQSNEVTLRTDMEYPELPCGFLGKDGTACRRRALVDVHGQTQGACRLHARNALVMRRMMADMAMDHKQETESCAARWTRGARSSVRAGGQSTDRDEVEPILAERRDGEDSKVRLPKGWTRETLERAEQAMSRVHQAEVELAQTNRALEDARAYAREVCRRLEVLEAREADMREGLLLLARQCGALES